MVFRKRATKNDPTAEESISKLTVEEVLGEGVVGHELRDEQALVPVAAVADQVGQAPVPQLPHSPGLLLRTKTKKPKAEP